MPGIEADPYEDVLDDIYCLTFVRDVDETEALRRMGGLDDTMRPRALADVGEETRSFDAGYPMIAQAMRLGAWTVVIEVNGFEGANDRLLAALSRGTEAVSVLRHDYASDWFGHAVDGTLLTAFDPMTPTQRWGAEPDRLIERMRAAGLDPDDDEALTDHVGALRLARRITGVLPDIPDGPLPSAHIEPWFSTAEPSGDRPPQADLVHAIDTAPPALRRAVVARELRRLAERLGVADTEGLAETLAAAERGHGVHVTADSALGRHVRDWLTGTRRAGNSLDDHTARHRMTEEERNRAFLLGWLADALRGALMPGSPGAVHTALRPLTRGPAWFADAPRLTAVRRALLGEEPPDRL